MMFDSSKQHPLNYATLFVQYITEMFNEYIVPDGLPILSINTTNKVDPVTHSITGLEWYKWGIDLSLTAYPSAMSRSDLVYAHANNIYSRFVNEPTLKLAIANLEAMPIIGCMRVPISDPNRFADELYRIKLALPISRAANTAILLME